MSVLPFRADGGMNPDLSMSPDEVIERYKNMVYGIAMTRVKNSDDADDVFQEVFLAYFRKQPEFNEEEHRKAWLIKTAVNCSRKAAGNPWRRRIEPLAEDSGGGAVFSFSSDEDTALYTALCGLPETYRTVLHLYYFEDLPAEQIGKLLGIRPGAVRMRMTRGREMLKEKLKGDYFDE